MLFGMNSKFSNFLRFLATQTQVAFNDNASKLVLIGLAHLLMPQEEAIRSVALIAFFLIIPFVLLAPVCGWLADRFPKRDVFFAALVLQAVVMATLCVAVLTRQFNLLLAGFFLLGAQSALMSPAKRGLARELYGAKGIGAAIGWMEMLVVVAILAGSFLGGELIDLLHAWWDKPWRAAAWSLLLLMGGCFLALALFRPVPAQPAPAPTPWRTSLLWSHFGQVRRLMARPTLFRAAIGESFFYFVGSVMVLSLTQLGRELNPAGPGTAGAAGWMMALTGAGVALGSLSAAWLNRAQLRLGLIPVGAMGMAGALTALAYATPQTLTFSILLALTGASGAWMLVTLSAFLVSRSPEETRGDILASANLLSSSASTIAIGFHALLALGLGLSVSAQFGVLAVLSLGAGLYLIFLLPDEVLRLLAQGLCKARYQVAVRGLRNLPAQGGALLVSNHVSYADAVFLSLASPRPVRFLAHASFFRKPLLGPILRIFGAVPVKGGGARAALTTAVELLREGELVCIFPEGELTRTGCVNRFHPGCEWIAQRSGAPVVPVYLDGVWGSIYSFSGGRYFLKIPAAGRRRVMVAFGLPVRAEVAKVGRLRREVLRLGAEAFASRPEWKTGLATRALRTLASRPWKLQLEDHTEKEPRTLRRGTLLALALMLSRKWARQFPEPRVGVLLPPGIAGTVANLALTFAGKVPVNLNPTVGPRAAAHMLEASGLECIISVERLWKKFPDYPRPARTIDFLGELKSLTGKEKLLAFASAWLLPTSVTAWCWNISRRSGAEEAALLFTSGSCAQPKGVPLSHANLAGNLVQVTETGVMRSGDAILSPLPLFHSFGLTIGLWYPLVQGLAMVTAPSPLEAQSIGRALKGGRPTVLAGTPTFLAQYARKLPPEIFAGLRMAIAGAEKLPGSVAERFEKELGVCIYEGYGLTEASPVVSLNRPEPAMGMGAMSRQAGAKAGSVGRLLPGLAYELRESGLEEGGLLRLRGVNILASYLDSADNRDRLVDGWYETGDIVSMDDDGFLYLQGRASRFSKIGGEMVSHAAVEEAIASAFGAAHEADGPADCVIGVEVEGRGEELVLCTTRAVELSEIRRCLQAAGLSNLCLPRRVVRVEALPMLASGKLDLGQCKRLARSETQTAGATVNA